MSADKTSALYEVLSPWAEADPIPLKGLSPRLDDLAGKKIGLLCNNKRAAPLILNVTERILKEIRQRLDFLHRYQIAFLPLLVLATALIGVGLEAAVFGFLPGLTDPESILNTTLIIVLSSCLCFLAAEVCALAHDIERMDRAAA